eukprot:CFRG6877T1
MDMNRSVPPAEKREDKGVGSICVRRVRNKSRVVSAQASYPLKWVNTSRPPSTAAWIFFLGYGGGLLDTDATHWTIDVGVDSCLMGMTLGNTNIFKSSQAFPVLNAISFHVAKGATLCWLPHPVTPYKDAKYEQRQEVYIEDESTSVVLLDWFTSGRMKRGERWEFHSLNSYNELRKGPKRSVVLRECLSLENIDGFPTVAERMGVFGVYGVLILLGPKAKPIIKSFTDACAQPDSSTAKPGKPTLLSSTVLISISPWEADGAIVRIASHTTAEAQKLLTKFLRPGVEEFANGFPWDLT